MFSHRKFFRLENLFNRPKKLKNISSQTLNGLIARMLNENTVSDQKEIEQSIASIVKDYLKGMNQYPEVVVRLNSI